MNKSVQNEYISSSLIKKAQKQPSYSKSVNLTFLDIDGTITGDKDKVNKLRDKLEKLGYGIILVTARTEGMIMSSAQYLKSKKLGFRRPPPKLDGKPEQIESKGILDPDIIIGSSGTAILVLQINGGYLLNTSYQKKLLAFKDWRVNTLKLLKKIDPQQKYLSLPAIEDPQNYFKGTADVLTPPFRIQLNFKNNKNKEYILEKIKYLPASRQDLNISDDSDPRIQKYSVFITPEGTSKREACEHVVNKICQTLSVNREKLDILFAGDALVDLEMGFLKTNGVHSTVLIVGGSNLSRKQIRDFTLSADGQPPERLIIGEEDYPGTIGPQTILAYLNCFPT